MVKLEFELCEFDGILENIYMMLLLPKVVTRIRKTLRRLLTPCLLTV